MFPLILSLLLPMQEPAPTTQTIKVQPTLLTSVAQPLTGPIAVKVRLDTDLTASRNRSLTVYIDGVSLGKPTTYQGNGSIGLFNYSWDVDTARLADGPHAIRMVTYATATSGDMRNYLRANELATFRTNNGQRLRDARNDYGTCFLAPGESISINTHAQASNGDSVLVPVTYRYDTAGAAIATIDATGRITALAPGETNVHAWLGTRYATTHVIVGPRQPVPSFGGKFVAAMFGLDGNEIDKTPGLAEAVQSAGVNAITTGIFQNKADGSGTDEQAVANNRKLVTRILEQADRLGLSILGAGDDICRSQRERDWTATSPVSADILREALTRLKASGRCVAIDMVDETNFALGASPSAQIRTIIGLMPPDRPSIGWPNAGGTTDASIAAWLAVSNHTTIYPNRTAYAIDDDGPTLATELDAYSAKDATFRRLMPAGMPKLTLCYIDGVTYQKVDADGEYTPGVDKVRTSGMRPSTVAATIFYAAMTGAAGVRVYGFDTAARKRARLNAAIGQSVSTGGEPGDGRWEAMAAALQLVHKLEPQLFGAPTHAPDLGEGIATAARTGPAGNLLMIANFRENAEPIRVDLAPYRLGGKVTRYTITATGSQAVDVDGAEDRIMLAPGQCLAYLFTGS